MTEERKPSPIAEDAAAPTEASSRWLAFLAEASTALGASLEYETTLGNVARLAVPTLGDWVSVHLRHADGSIRPLIVVSANPAKLDVAQGLQDRYVVSSEQQDHPVARAIRTGTTQANETSDAAMAAAAIDAEHLRLLRASGIQSYVVAPLTAAGQVFGALGFAYAESGRTYSSADVSLIEDLARRAGTAIHNALLVRQLEHTQQSLRESQARLNAFLEQLPVGVGLFDKEGRWVIRNRTLSGLVEDWIPSRDPSKTPRWRAWDADGSPLDPSQWPAARALRGDVVSPGVDFLHVLADGREIWMRISAAPFRDASGQIGGGIAVIEDVHERKQAAARLDTVARIAQGLLRHATLQDVLSDLVEQTRTALQVDEATILLTNDDGSSLTVRASLGINDEYAREVRIPIGRGVAGRVAATRQSWIIADLSQVEVFRRSLKRAVRSLLSVPITINDRVLGVLHVGTVSRHDFTTDDRTFLELIAERAASIVERARLHDAEHDARAAAEAARMATETASEQLRLALEAGRMGTWQYALGDGKVTWSAGLEAIHGFAPGSFPGTFQAFRNEIYPADRDYVLNAIATAVTEGRDHHVEYRIIRSDGAVRWVEGRGQLFLDNERRPERMVGVCMDITDRKHAEEKFRLAVEAAPAAMVMVDAQGTIVLANALAESLFGYTREELVGEPIDTLVPSHFRQSHPSYRRAYFAESKPRPMGAGRDLYALRKDGSEVPVEIGLSPIATADGRFVLAGVTDITERVRLHEAERAARAEAEAANRAKADFVAAISHDLRTPLNAISGYAQLLEMEVKGALNEPQKEAVSRILQNQQRMLALLNELLRFARVEARQVEYRLEDLLLDPLLASLETTIAPQVREKGVSYSYRPCDPALIVRADRDKLEQVLMNLLTNALKYTDAGRVTMEAEAAEGFIAIHVRDTGRGIAAPDLGRVFEPFVQVGTEASDGGAGVGLGLAISRELARGMGGEVTAQSIPGEGSTFTTWVARAGS